MAQPAARASRRLSSAASTRAGAARCCATRRPSSWQQHRRWSWGAGELEVGWEGGCGCQSTHGPQRCAHGIAGQVPDGLSAVRWTADPVPSMPWWAVGGAYDWRGACNTCRSRALALALCAAAALDSGNFITLTLVQPVSIDPAQISPRDASRHSHANSTTPEHNPSGYTTALQGQEHGGGGWSMEVADAAAVSTVYWGAKRISGLPVCGRRPAKRVPHHCRMQTVRILPIRRHQ